MRELQWYLVRTKPPANPNRVVVRMYDPVLAMSQRKFVTELMLGNRGFETFLPVDKVWRRKSKYTRDKRLVSYPLIPGWLFVGWPADENRWAELFNVPIVHAVASVDGEPYRMPPDVMDWIFNAWGDRQAPEQERFMRTHHEFKVGDLVRVAEGSFEGHTVRVVDIRGAAVKAVFWILGCEREIEIDARVLEVA
ncbi:MAG: transcription termination/antitermination NusG family protein [Pseudomonadota bacterium]